MAGKGFWASEEGHVVNLFPPTTETNGLGFGDWMHMKESSHASIIITCGAITNATTVTLYEASNSSGSSNTAIVFNLASATSTDIFGAISAATTGGFTTDTTNNSSFVIEVDASQLTDGKPYIGLHTTTAAANVFSAVAVLSGRRYAEDIGLSATD